MYAGLWGRLRVSDWGMGFDVSTCLFGGLSHCYRFVMVTLLGWV